MNPALALLSLSPLVAGPSIRFLPVQLAFGGRPERLLVGPLDAGPTDDVTLMARREIGVYDLISIGLVGSSLQGASLPLLASIGYAETPSMAAADVNGDGVLDLGIAPSFASQVFYGNGDLTYTPGQVLPTAGGSQHGVGFVDINGDELLDSVLLVNDLGGLFLDYGLNTGSGGFSSGNFAFAPGTTAFEHRLLFADAGGLGAVSTFITGGSGLARTDWPGGASTDELVLAGSFAEVAAAELDGTGGLDLVLCGRESNGVEVLLNDGSGEFPSALSYGTGRYPESLAIADLDGDGALDLAVANRREHSVAILRGDGTGAFELDGKHAVGREPVDIAVGDVDGNGTLDLVVACFADRVVTVLLGV